MTDELKPCPFCGFSPEIDEVDFLYPLTRERDVWGAHCYETGGGCGLCVVGDSKEGALKAWNRRISDTAGAKPTCVHAENPKACYRVRCQLGNKCIDDDLSFRAPPAPSVADAQDAARWREMLKHIGMWLSGGRRMVWAFGDGLPVPRETDYYKDSAAERFSQAIDAAIAKESGK